MWHDALSMIGITVYKPIIVIIIQCDVTVVACVDGVSIGQCLCVLAPLRRVSSHGKLSHSKQNTECSLKALTTRRMDGKTLPTESTAEFNQKVHKHAVLPTTRSPKLRLLC